MEGKKGWHEENVQEYVTVHDKQCAAGGADGEIGDIQMREDR